METIGKRLEDIIEGLSPVDKARLVIEDHLRDKPVLFPVDRRKMLTAIGPEEGRRYNSVVDRYHILKDNLDALSSLADDVKMKLLHRDRLLWYRDALKRLEEAIVFGKAAKPLLIDNPNLKAGKPLEIRTLFATFRLGVWGRKNRFPFPKEGSVELTEEFLEALDLPVARIRATAGELKAVYRYIIEEARSLGLETAEGRAVFVLRRIVEYDRPTAKDILQGEAAELARGAILPVDERWALVWEEIAENPETAKRIREDPQGWMPICYEQDLAELPDDMVDYLRGLAWEGLGRG
ncbi:MAG TPA: hypothetical protein VFA32_15085 [Dehalococcoidia bacterium]|nr:hypothetical protein [Dehalococcoidia bacterium]